MQLTVNGETRQVTGAPETSLLEALRDQLGLTGAKYGCGEARCGACVVLLDGAPVASCVTSLAEVAERSVTTVEGLSSGERLHPVQQAFVDVGALQCGYCTPGMIVAAVALLTERPEPTYDEILEAMQPHVCRCGAYTRIVEAIRLAAKRMSPGGSGSGGSFGGETRASSSVPVSRSL